MTEFARRSADIVRARAPHHRPRVGIVLGSGLGGLATRIERPVEVSYEDLPGFPLPTVEGHAGRLVLGDLAGMPVACLAGRVHLYEGHAPVSVATLIRTLRVLGCDTLLLTNAAGGLHPAMRAGDLMLIADHINMQGQNPLVGPNDASFGPRFPAMTAAYDPQLRAGMRSVADGLGIDLHEGVYTALLGPCFETPAEIRAFRTLGADAVGMSTVPEVIVGRHCGMRVVAISVITNLGAGLADEHLSHEQTLAAAHGAAHRLEMLATEFLAWLGREASTAG